MEVINDDNLIVSLGHYIDPKDKKKIPVLTAGRMIHETTEIRAVKHLEGDAAQAMYDLLTEKEEQND